MATKIGTINPSAGPTGATGPTGPSGPSGPGGGGGGGGGISIPEGVLWTSFTTYHVGEIVNHRGWLFVALVENTDANPFTDTAGTWRNIFTPVPPTTWVDGGEYGLYQCAVWNGAVWAALGPAIITEPSMTNPEWFRLYRIVPEGAATTFTGHGTLPDPPPAGAVDGDLYVDLDTSTLTPISIP